jgi:peptidoglycan LD-endopeptidase LytH
MVIAARLKFTALTLPFLLQVALACALEPFRLPTANRALFEPGQQDKFFVGTVGKSWESGCFGCVRSDGWQMHEGLDIRCLQRDKRGEPIDSVMAVADGTVAYINKRPSLSNYGNYVVLKHRLNDVEIYSLYAHLREVQSSLKVGQVVTGGQAIATMGRTSNTREGISKDRAHVHLEFNFLINERFAAWYKKSSPGQRNDHGMWNGQNMLGIDPKLVFLAERDQGSKFNLVNFLKNQTELCRVLVRKPEISWAKRYGVLVRNNPTANREGTAGYELALNFNGVPFELIPRAASEIKSSSKYQLLSVNEAEYRRNPCRKLVAQRGSRWTLAPRGTSLLDLLTY